MRASAKPSARSAVPIAATLLVACGGGSSSGSRSSGDGGSPDGTFDAPAADAGVDADDGDAADQADAFATGAHLVDRPSTFQGLTSDGYVVFSEPTDAGGQIAEVTGLDGGAVTAVATGTEGATALKIAISGPVAFVWTNRGGGMAPMTIWSRATGVVAEGSVRPGRAAATPDGTTIAYVNNVVTATADIVVSAAASTSPTKIATFNASDTTCWQDVDLAFSGSPPRLVSFYCPASSSAFTLASAATDGGGGVTLSGVSTGEVIGTSRVAFADSSGNLHSVAPDGTGALRLASKVQNFELSNDQSTVAYQGVDLSIGTTPIASAGARVAVPAGKSAMLGPLAPDNGAVLFSTIAGDAGTGAVGTPTDVRLAPVDGGALRALVPAATSCAGCLDDSFTPDSTYALAIDPIDDTPAAGGTGPLHVFPLDGGADYRLGTDVWTVLALGSGSGAASRFLFVQAIPAPSLLSGYVYELYTRSLDPSDTPAEIARDVEWAGLDTARTFVVYSVAGTGPEAGVWVARLE